MKDLIWYEKYRPPTIDDMIFSEHYENKFREYIDNNTFPHLLFVGPPGSGKTTLSRIFIDTIPSVALRLNASSERGIDTIRDKVKVFASSQPPKEKIKIVFLDEADDLTMQAQDSLKSVIEVYSKTCRFIFTANSQEKIILPIQSRCAIFKFESFPKRKVFDILTHILKTENIKYNLKDLKKLIDNFYPDIRSIINNLDMGCSDGRFNIDFIINDVADINQVVELIMDGNVKELRLVFNNFIDFGWLYKGFFDYLLITKDLTEDEKFYATLKISEYLYKDAVVLDREINAIACCIEIMEILKCKIHFNS